MQAIRPATCHVASRTGTIVVEVPFKHRVASPPQIASVPMAVHLLRSSSVLPGNLPGAV